MQDHNDNFWKIIHTICILLGVAIIIWGTTVFQIERSGLGTIITIVGITIVTIASTLLYLKYEQNDSNSIIWGWFLAIVTCVGVCIFGFKSCIKESQKHKYRHHPYYKNGKRIESNQHIHKSTFVWHGISEKECPF